MLIILLGAVLAYSRVGAIPISPIPATDPVLSVVHPRCDCSGTTADGRTIYDIVKSCLFTIAACVYRAVHQNIPDPELGFWGRLRVTIKVILCALIAPELMIWWAMRQWFGAREVVRLMNRANPKLKWTKVHGQFAQMGGFARKDNRRVLHPYPLRRLLRDGRVDVEELQLTEKEIQDKSKGDILSKILVSFQTTWFVFECIARLQQGLPLIELEVVTLAFATLNLFTYALWWYKPLNVLCPIYIHVQPGAPDPAAEPNPEPSPQVVDAVNLGPVSAVGGEANLTEALVVPVATSNPVSALPSSQGEVPIRRIETTNEGPSGKGFGKALMEISRRIPAAIKADIQEGGWWWMLWKRLMKQPFVAVTLPLKELLEDEEDNKEATHVSTFFATGISWGDETLVQALSSFLGMIFGAIHFLSWDSTFPTHVELLSWRISSIVLVVPPYFLLLRAIFIHIWLKYGSKRWLIGNGMDTPVTRSERMANLLRKIFEYISFFGGPIPYVVARICVLVLAFLTLHDLPHSALTNVSWTSYIPHL
ncbi:hypothetical protein BDN72DRAFT_180077 [Pluteus cervinus]|uniref:Uncharacterized protein n=1 Tax=Pluteus cervinus TaxID=181527 RepID=A0ACD3AJL6_9AGAR|nr:hypothetical protein BDN72DRAFT_180077 [Pluteus cervinus]